MRIYHFGTRPIYYSKYVCGDIQIHNNYNNDKDFLIEFLQTSLLKGRLRMTEAEKRKIIPAIHFSYMFEHRFGAEYLLSNAVNESESERHAQSLNHLLDKFLTEYVYTRRTG